MDASSRLVPIPHPRDISAADLPTWEPRLVEMATELIRLGAKASIITRYTGVKPKVVTKMYLRITGDSAPFGPMKTSTPQFYAAKRGHSWHIQCAIFAQCYMKLADSFGVSGDVNNVWLLLHAFRTYISITEKMSGDSEVKRLDINQAFGLMVHMNWGGRKPTRGLWHQTCPDCSMTYLMIVDYEVDTQNCPVCAMNKNFKRLVTMGRDGAKKEAPGISKAA